MPNFEAAADAADRCAFLARRLEAAAREPTELCCMETMRFALLSGLALFVGGLGIAQEPKAPVPKEGKETKAPASGGAAEAKPEFPTFEEVSKGYQPVVASEGAFYALWHRKKDAQLLAELPQNFETQKQMIALARPTGEDLAGLQSGDLYCHWKRYDKRLALVAPNLDTRSSGDQESKDALRKTQADRVLLDTEILCMGPNGQPVIDLDEVLLGNLPLFYGAGTVQKQLATVVKAKVFPKNVEVAFEVVENRELKTYHFSISEVAGSAGYKPRLADDRIGYFTTSYRDLGKIAPDQTWQRPINRWHLEKADPNLQKSPPKQPIVFYVEHTVPVRFRRFVKQGALWWNEAFAAIGIVDAIEVHYQDKATGAHMEKDPEDLRYSFIRWVSNDIGLAIGPSRAHPETGEILDADVILTDAWIRAFWRDTNELVPPSVVEGLSPAALAWLEQHPNWDPRQRAQGVRHRQRLAAGLLRREALAAATPGLPGAARGALHGSACAPELCQAAMGKAWTMAFAHLALEAAGLLHAEGDDKAEKPATIDGIPEWLLGPLLADLTAHEVGHTLGLRHNFKASSVYTFEQVNSPEWKGKRPLAGSVMDYLPLNLALDDQGKLKGDVCMIGVGPYDKWAIEYGYTLGEPAKVLERVAEPELAFATDFDTWGADPRVRRYDFAADTLAFAQSRIELAQKMRGRILDKFVKPGQSWAKARHAYEITLREQSQAVGMMAAWLGGTFAHRDHKGDKGARTPLVAVPVAQQRAALRFVLANACADAAYGLSPELLSHLAAGRWDEDGSAYDVVAFDVHQRVAELQAEALTFVLHPETLARVHDNELLVAASQDAVTLPEVFDAVTDEVWSELGLVPGSEAPVRTGTGFTVRQPALSSLRRNLQREHLDRLADLALQAGSSAAERAMATLARRSLQRIFDAIRARGGKLDAYSEAHLEDAQRRILKILDASYTLNGGRSGNTYYYFGAGREAEVGK
ncbi:MAG: zinc-dependent metalloprotease [Planctomycetes bacterium]|nr:zinc-dependent metalloprotease [Planctomycetota bacterium]